MFNRYYLKSANQVIVYATEEARRHNHDHIRTEHLLLGLIQEEKGMAAYLLHKLGLNIEEIRIELEKLFQPGLQTQNMDDIPFSPSGQNVLTMASEEASALGHHYIGTEHLLLGLVKEEKGMAFHVLANLGLDLVKCKHEVKEVLGLNELAKEGKLDHTIGRNEGIKHVSQILGNICKDIFIPFDEHARIVINDARNEAVKLKHDFIGTEHLLIALFRFEDPVIDSFLNQIGISLEQIYNSFKPNPITDQDYLVFALPTKLAFGHTLLEAKNLHQNFISPEMLLLALLRLDQSGNYNVLLNSGLASKRDAMIDNIRKKLGGF